MNRAITEGLALMPPPFAAGLGQWSSGDGTPGSDTYAGAGGGSFIPADQDFGGALELVKTSATQRLRYMGQTPILPGLVLRVRARVKALAGPLPSVRIAGFAARANGTALPGVVTSGAAVALSAYGAVTEVSALIGTGPRPGTTMVWNGAVWGHLGLDFTGANGAVLRVDDIEIEDATDIYLRDMLAMVDVRDFGARGDGTGNDTAAFLAADAAAAGREVLVPAGIYQINGHVTFANPVRFEGKVRQPVASRFILMQNFDFASYASAFETEDIAFRKAWQALMNQSDHIALDLGGRRVGLEGPVDMQACDPGRTALATRRVIQNGLIHPIDGPGWSDRVVTSTASYASGTPKMLTNVANIANILPGSLVTGTGVGREVYVTSVDVAQSRLVLSAELFGPAASQSYTFRRFRYMLDFSGYTDLSTAVLAEIDFFCEGRASAVLLGRGGTGVAFRDCHFTKPKDRAITSHGTGCQGLLVDRCQFISNELDLPVPSRSSIALNVNSNDPKLRDCRVVRFRHFCVLGGSGAVISGNHWFHGDATTGGVRLGGIVLTTPNVKTFVTGNYIDNNFIEWTNEHDATPGFDAQYSFGGLTVTGNIFTVNDVAPWFTWLVVKPYDAGHFLNGVTVTDNVFRTVNCTIDRVERVDSSIATLDFTKMRGVTFTGNVFHGITAPVRNPASISHLQSTASQTWLIETAGRLPFNGHARTVEAVVAEGPLRNAANQPIFEYPYIETGIGALKQQVRAGFATPCTGRLRIQVRMDDPG